MDDRTAAEGSTRVLCGAYIEEAPSFIAGIAVAMGGNCAFEPAIPRAVVEEVSCVGSDSRSMVSVLLLVLGEGTDSGWKFR
jgi:hypothetical protein